MLHVSLFVRVKQDKIGFSFKYVFIYFVQEEKLIQLL